MLKGGRGNGKYGDVKNEDLTLSPRTNLNPSPINSKKEGLSFSMKDAIQRMTSKGVWLSEGVIDFALYHAGEKGF